MTHTLCLDNCQTFAFTPNQFGVNVIRKIAESIFASLPDAVACDGKNLNCVGWQFLAAELRNLPEMPADIQAAIDPVIAGMDLLAAGQTWPAAKAAEARHQCRRLGRLAAAESASWAAAGAADAAWAAESADAAWAAADAADAAWAAESAAWAAAGAAKATAEAAQGAAAGDACRRRQRDLLLRLISEAPVVEMGQ